MLPLSQFLLLQTASPDAIVRLQNTVLEERKEIEEVYFTKLHHQSVEEFLTDQLDRCRTKGGLLIQVTITVLEETHLPTFLSLIKLCCLIDLSRSPHTVTFWLMMNLSKSQRPLE